MIITVNLSLFINKIKPLNNQANSLIAQIGLKITTPQSHTLKNKLMWLIWLNQSDYQELAR